MLGLSPRKSAARKDSDSTLVDSPTTTRAIFWKRALPHKRRSSNDSASAASQASWSPVSPVLETRQTPKRGGTGDTLVEEGRASPGKIAEEDVVLDETQREPDRTTSPAPEQEQESPRRTRRWYSPKKENSDSEFDSRTNSAALLVARAFAQIAEASNVPYLKGVAGLATLILETADVCPVF